MQNGKAVYQVLKDTICKVIQWVFSKKGVCMGKIKQWIDQRAKKGWFNYSLQDFLADMLLVGTGVAFVVLSDMGHKHGRVYILAGIFACFALRRLYSWFFKKRRITRVTKTKAFKRNFNYVLAVGGLLLTIAGLYSALVGIQVTVEGNTTRSNELPDLNTWISVYHDLIYGLFGLLIGGLILLAIQLIRGKGEEKNKTEAEKQPTKPSNNNPSINIDLKVNTSDYAQMKHEQISSLNQTLRMIDKLQRRGATVKKEAEDGSEKPKEQKDGKETSSD